MSTKQARTAKRGTKVRDADEPRRAAGSGARRNTRRAERRSGEAQARRRSTREQRPLRSAPQTNPIPRPTDTPGRPKNASQAKARAKARKAKAPKVVRPSLRERLLVRLASIDLNPRTLVARVPFVVLVIGSLGVGLGTTLWLSTDAAERSYQLSGARETNEALQQQKEALERDVLEAQSAPALAEAARKLGMIPSRDTAHLVQDATGNWVVVGTPKPAEGVPPPPLNTPLPDAAPAPAAAPPAPRVVEPREVTVRVTPTPAPGVPHLPGVPAAPLAVPHAPEVPYTVPSPGQQMVPAPVQGAPAPLDALHVPTPQALPGPLPGAEQAGPPAVATPAA